MQLIAEAYDLIRRGTGKTPAEIADVFAEWNKGELESYLIEITAEVLRQVDAETGKPLVDVILDQAGLEGHRRRGPCRPRSTSASRSPGIAEAVFARVAVVASPRSAPRHPRSARPGRGAHGRRRRRVHRGRAPGALRVEDRRLLAGLRRDRRRRRAVRLGHQEGRRSRRSGAAAASSAPSSSTASPRRTPQTPASSRCHRAVLRRCRRPHAGSLAPRGRDGRAAPASRRPRSRRRSPTTTACAPTACPPRSCRASATSSARTPTSASTRTAPSTPCGRATAPRSRRRDAH